MRRIKSKQHQNKKVKLVVKKPRKRVLDNWKKQTKPQKQKVATVCRGRPPKIKNSISKKPNKNIKLLPVKLRKLKEIELKVSEGTREVEVKEVEVFEEIKPFNIIRCKKPTLVVSDDEPSESETLNIEKIRYKPITNFDVGVVRDPLVGTPKEVQIELDKLALRLQKHPKDEECFNKIHCYIHKYLLGLVFKKFNFIKGYDESDMYQESLIALFKKAIPKFNPNKGMSFLNFAKMCINRHLITILHASKHRKKDIPMNTAISIDHSPAENDDDNMSPLSNVIADDDKKTMPFKKLVDKESFACTLQTVKEKLSKFEAVVLEEYLNEKSYKEVAKNVSKKLSVKFNAKSVDNALLRIRKKAEQLLSESGEQELPLFY